MHLQQHPAPPLFAALLFLRGLAFIAAAAPVQARQQLAPLRAGVWINNRLMGTGTGLGPLSCAVAGWLAALFELVPALSSEYRMLHGTLLSASVGSLLVNFVQLVRSHPGPVQLVEHPGDATCDICNACKPPRAHHCAECGRCALRMDHHCSWTGNCVGLRELFQSVEFVPLALADYFDCVDGAQCTLQHYSTLPHPSCSRAPYVAD